VVEGIYANTGDVAPLAEIARLKYKCAPCFWSSFAVASWSCTHSFRALALTQTHQDQLQAGLCKERWRADPLGTEVPGISFCHQPLLSPIGEITSLCSSSSPQVAARETQLAHSACRACQAMCLSTASRCGSSWTRGSAPPLLGGAPRRGGLSLVGMLLSDVNSEPLYCFQVQVPAGVDESLAPGLLAANFVLAVLTPPKARLVGMPAQVPAGSGRVAGAGCAGRREQHHFLFGHISI